MSASKRKRKHLEGYFEVGAALLFSCAAPEYPARFSHGATLNKTRERAHRFIIIDIRHGEGRVARLLFSRALVTTSNKKKTTASEANSRFRKRFPRRSALTRSPAFVARRPQREALPERSSQAFEIRALSGDGHSGRDLLVGNPAGDEKRSALLSRT